MKNTIQYQIVAFILLLAPSEIFAQSVMSASVMSTGSSQASASGKSIQASLGQSFIGVSGASGKNTGAGYWYLISESQVSTDIETLDTQPNSFSLNNNYPNPFNPETSFSFTLPKQGRATLIVYDMLGNEMERIVDQDLPAGEFRTSWNAEGMSSGTYFYRLESQGLVLTKKMTLLK